MSPASRHFYGLLRQLAWPLALLALATAAFLWYGYHRLPAVNPFDAPRVAPAIPAWQNTHPCNTCNWLLVESVTGAMVSDEDAVTRRFRLAGTFSVELDSGHTSRKAVVDDKENAVQLIVSEGEDLAPEITVSSIFRDRVILQTPSGEHELRLIFAGGEGGGAGALAGRGPAGGSTGGGALNRFGGKQVGERNWLFERQALLAYYEELRDEPTRLLQVFDSLKPEYNAESKITGYRLGVEGEADFFRGIGMQEGDIVRSVNSMPMTNRRRAEFLISEFINNRANVFVLDLERSGKVEKHRYQVR